MKDKADSPWDHFPEDWPERIKGKVQVSQLAFDSAQHLFLKNLTCRFLTFMLVRPLYG